MSLISNKSFGLDTLGLIGLSAVPYGIACSKLDVPGAQYCSFLLDGTYAIFWFCTAALLLSLFQWSKSFTYINNRKVESKSFAKANSNLQGDAQYDIVIVGAGVAGGALATALGKKWQHDASKRILVVEKDLTEPDRIVGELLQPGGVDELVKMDIPEVLEGFDALPVTGYAVFQTPDKHIRLRYPNNTEGKQETGRGMHNGRFLTSLRKACASYPAVDLIEGNVNKLVEEDGQVVGVEYRAEGKTVQARGALTIVCDGCFSAFRRNVTDGQVLTTSKFLGLLCDSDGLPFPATGHVLLIEPTPMLAYPVSSTEARLLIDFPGDIPDKANGDLQRYLMEHTYPQLPEALKPMFREAVEDGSTLQSMPNRLLASRPSHPSGMVLVGDIVNMRHPLTGGGMTVALRDCRSLFELLTNDCHDSFGSQSVMSGKVNKYYSERSAHNRVVNLLADALYQVFSNGNADLRAACFDYLSHEALARHPVQLLAGLLRAQSVLLVHFTMVAFYGCFQLMFPCPSPWKIVRCINMLRSAAQIMLPLVVRDHNNMFTTLICQMMALILWVDIYRTNDIKGKQEKSYPFFFYYWPAVLVMLATAFGVFTALTSYFPFVNNYLPSSVVSITNPLDTYVNPSNTSM